MTGFGAAEGPVAGRPAPGRDPDRQPPLLQSRGEAPRRSQRRSRASCASGCGASSTGATSRCRRAGPSTRSATGGFARRPRAGPAGGRAAPGAAVGAGPRRRRDGRAGGAAAGRADPRQRRRRSRCRGAEVEPVVAQAAGRTAGRCGLARARRWPPSSATGSICWSRRAQPIARPRARAAGARA